MIRTMIFGLLALSACAAQGITSEPPQVAGNAVPVPSPSATPSPHVATSVVAKADTVILTGERAFAVAELTYTTAANGVGRLVDAGMIRGATATRVRAWNREGRDLLVKGKAGANVAEQARIAARLFGLTDNLNSVAGAH